MSMFRVTLSAEVDPTKHGYTDSHFRDGYFDIYWTPVAKDPNSKEQDDCHEKIDIDSSGDWQVEELPPVNFITIFNRWNDAQPKIIFIDDCDPKTIRGILAAIAVTADTYGSVDLLYVSVNTEKKEMNFEKSLIKDVLEIITPEVTT